MYLFFFFCRAIVLVEAIKLVVVCRPVRWSLGTCGMSK
jgi:hypothetical protein